MKWMKKHLRMSEEGGGEGESGGGSEGAFMGGGDAGGTDSGQDAGTGNDSDVQYSYPKGLDESFHGNPTLLKFADKEGQFDQAGIAKALIHATSTIGADKMMVPNKNFTSEQWTETYRKLGVPEKIEDYKLNVEGASLDEKLVQGYTQKAHELGIHPNQAQGIMEYFNEYSGAQSTDQTAQFQQQLDADTAALKTEWGEAYSKNLNIADQALKHFYPEEADRKSLIETGFLDTIQGTKFFNRLGAALGEDTFDHDTQASFGSSPEEITGQIAETYTELAAMGKGHPQYNSKMAKYNALLAKKHGTASVGPTR